MKRILRMMWDGLMLRLGLIGICLCIFFFGLLAPKIVLKFFKTDL